MSDSKALERAEIIAALRYCASEGGCKGCPLGGYDGITCAGFSGMLRDAASLLERDTEPPNDPLTLEELRGMDGEPVWVVFEPDADADRLTMWALVDVIGNEIELRNNLGGHSTLQNSMMVDGNHIDIYRRKPDEGGK